RRSGGFERQLHLEQVADEFLVREAITDTHAGQAVDFRKRAQRDYVVITVVHGIGVAGVVLGVLEIGFVQDDKDALRDMLVELVELVFSENGAGWVIGIGEVDDFGVGVDLFGQRRKVVMPVVI